LNIAPPIISFGQALFFNLSNTTTTMGKGDKKSRRGKLTKGTFGKKRPHKPKSSKNTAKPEKAASA
jgi:30S ribosomal protein S31